MRRPALRMCLFLLLATVGAAWCDQPVQVLVQQRPFQGHYLLDAHVWWIEANALAGAIGVHPGDIKATIVPPDHMQIVYKGATFTVSARQYANEIFVDAQAFVKGMGGQFSCPPQSAAVEITVPMALSAPPPPAGPIASPARPAAPNSPGATTVPAVKIDAFRLAVGAKAASGIPFQAHVELDNPSTQTLAITLRVMEGDTQLNQLGPAQLPPGKHNAEWVFYATPSSSNIKVDLLVGNQVVATRPLDPAGSAGPGAAESPAASPSSSNPLDATPGGTPSGY